jgi:hypothetical protein
MILGESIDFSAMNLFFNMCFVLRYFVSKVRQTYVRRLSKKGVVLKASVFVRAKKVAFVVEMFSLMLNQKSFDYVFLMLD